MKCIADKNKWDKMKKIFLESEIDKNIKFDSQMMIDEVAAHFNEKIPDPEPTLYSPANPEEFEEWEKKQDNSNDIYKINARIKNLARYEANANLTPQGDMVCNSFTHALKSFYDFAETIENEELRTKLLTLTRDQEMVPANLIAALKPKTR